MERLDARDARDAKLASAPAGLVLGDGDEAVVLAVRGGQVAAAVPVGISEEDAIGAARIVRGVVRLENERVLTFQIQAGGDGAAFGDESAHLREPDGSLFGGAPRRAADIMTEDVVTASADMLVEDVAKLLAFHNISGMPVEDWDGTIIGVVSEVDVIDKVGDTIGDVMTPHVISVTEATPIEEIAGLMADRKIRRVPVLTDGSLVGIVTRADIVRALAARVSVAT
jgi:CBS domain-containing protein